MHLTLFRRIFVSVIGGLKFLPRALAMVASSPPLNGSSTIPASLSRPPTHPDAETRIFSLAQPLEEPDRSAFIRAASEAVEKLGANAYGPGALHRLLAPLWHQFFHPPSETSPTNRSRAYHPDDDEAEARALTKLARGLPRQTEEVRRLRYRRKPIARYAS